MMILKEGFTEQSLELEHWRKKVLERARLRVRPTTLDACKNWSLTKGHLRHTSGRYFGAVGVAWDDHHSILLEQREIGTLATVIRRRNDEIQVLVQAKIEPGNTGGVQFAPTAQATASNADRVHGGNAPPFVDYFETRRGTLLSSSLQSEQGQKFLGKRNHNMLVRDDTLDTAGPIHRWVPFKSFRGFLLEDFRVNTDLRSVLCAGDWHSLSCGSPFSGQDELSSELRGSLLSPIRSDYLETVRRQLDLRRHAAPQVLVRGITSLPGWAFRADCDRVLVSSGNAIRLIRVEVETREIRSWDQPIYDTRAPQIADLDCGIVAGCLRFCFTMKWEPGLAQKVELGPTRHARWTPERMAVPSLLSVWQSDEGGRFFHDDTLYRVVRTRSDAGETDQFWLSLSEIQALMKSGIFNNEARSALSLILARL